MPTMSSKFLLLALAGGASAGGNFLGGTARMNPQEVSRLLGSVEKKWVREATTAYDGEGDEAEAFFEMEQSCFKIATAVIDASAGDRNSVSEYMDEVCDRSPTAENVKPLCQDFGVTLLRYMSEDAGLNRENFDRKKFCKAVYGGKVTELAESASKHKKEESASKHKKEDVKTQAPSRTTEAVGPKAVVAAPALQHIDVQKSSDEAIDDFVDLDRPIPASAAKKKKAEPPSIVDRIMAGEKPPQNFQSLPERVADGFENVVDSMASSVEAEASRLLGPVRRALAANKVPTPGNRAATPPPPGWSLPDRFMERLENSVAPRKPAGLSDKEASKLRPEEEGSTIVIAASSQPKRLTPPAHARNAPEIHRGAALHVQPAHAPLDYTLAVGAFPVGQLPVVPGAPLPGQAQALSVTTAQGTVGKHAMSSSAQAALRAAMRREDEMKAAWAARHER